MERDNNKGLIIILILLIIAVIVGTFFAISNHKKSKYSTRTIYINSKKYKIEGINEEIIKYVSTSKNSCFGVGILVLTDNNLYFGESSGKKIHLTKINTKEKVVDITNKAIEPNKSGTGECNSLSLFAVLKNKQIRPIKLKYHENNNSLNAYLASYDVSKIKYQLDDILILNDQTITTVNDFVNNNKNIMLDNNLFKIDSILGKYYVENNKLVSKPSYKQQEPHMMCYLVLSNEKYYSMCGSAYSYEPPRIISSIKLYSDDIISYDIVEDNNETIVNLEHKDGSNEELNASKSEIYEFK